MPIPEGPIDVPPEAIEALGGLQELLAESLSQPFRVGIGIQQTGGEFTGVVALRVFVEQKRPPNEVREGELIPAEFAGFPVDVQQDKKELLSDTAVYDPVRGGIQIARPPTPVGGVAVIEHTGTAGAVVKRRSDGRKLLLTNDHVAGAVGNPISQPVQSAPGSTVIGSVVATDPTLDCAIIETTRNVESTIVDIGPCRGAAPLNPQLWQAVRKRGARTLLTSGVVTDLVLRQLAPLQWQEIYLSAFPFNQMFADSGDSGSVVVDANNQVIALLYACRADAAGVPDTTTGIATLIEHVQDALQVDVAIAPEIININPRSALASVGTLGQITIDGWGFDCSPFVDFGGIPAPVISCTFTQLVVVPPLHLPGTIDVRVTNPDGETSGTGPQTTFEYEPII